MANTYNKPIDYRASQQLSDAEKQELTAKLHALLDTMDTLNVSFVEQAAQNGQKTGGMVTALPKE
jgi:hypothetical protein